MSRAAATRLLQYSAVLGAKKWDALSIGIRNEANRGFQTGSEEPRSSKHSKLALASLLGLGTSCAAYTAVASASDSGTESVTVGGITVSASGGAKIQKEVIFVLGGPGSGKGTQCANLTQEFNDIAHFSAGDLLRELVKSGTPEGDMVANMIKEGVIVPSEVTVNLLKRAMAASGKHRILIDGFPRNLENRDAFERVVGYDCKRVLFFDCPEEVMEQRLLGRNQGRVDDNIETIRKRFKVFLQQTLPVIEYYEQHGKVNRIKTDRPAAEVYSDVRELFVQK